MYQMTVSVGVVFWEGGDKGGLQIISEATLKTTALFAPHHGRETNVIKQESGFIKNTQRSHFPWKLHPGLVLLPLLLLPSLACSLNFIMRHRHQTQIYRRGTVTRVAAATWISTPRSVTAPGRRTEDEKKKSALSGKKEKTGRWPLPPLRGS